jgi:hypothetical protein
LLSLLCKDQFNARESVFQSNASIQLAQNEIRLEIFNNLMIPYKQEIPWFNEYIVTDFINALSGNGSVNTVQHGTIEERGYATHF